MTSRIPSPSRPIHWVFDWDGTLSKRDTLDALVNIAIKYKPDFPVPEEWKRVTEAYLCDYESTLNTHAPDGKLPYSVTEEKNLLRILEDVEQRSIDRVSMSAIFKGLIAKEIDDGAAKAIESGEVQMREGCINFFQCLKSRIDRQHEQPDAVKILSVNWSQRFIATCLKTAHAEWGQPILDSIHSNELEGIKEGKQSSGHISVDGGSKIISSRDKLACLEQIRNIGKGTGSSVPVVYVGDSWTDFECLLSADLGICIRDDPMTSTQKKLADSLARVGVRCSHLQDVEEVDQWTVVWAKDFYEIQNWVQKPS